MARSWALHRSRALRQLAFVVTGCVLTVLTTGVGTATAATCSLSNHCYARVAWTGGPPMGNISGHLDTTNVAIASGNFVNQEAWIDTWGDGSFSTWIEQGLKWGHTPKNTDFYGWFWEDFRPGDTSVNFHATSLSWNAGVDYPWGFHYHGSNTWYLQRSDVGNYATSTSPGPTTAAISGTEFGSASDKSCGTQDSLAYQLSGSYTQHFGWNYGSSVAAMLPPDAPATQTFSSYQNQTWHLNC
jgi:hypothetical protein